MKRRFFQIHLLTALVGMLAAAGMLWLNMREQVLSLAHPFVQQNKGAMHLQAMLLFNRGWPVVAAQERTNIRPLLTFHIKGETSRTNFGSDRVVPIVQIPWADYHQGWANAMRLSSRYATWQEVLRSIPEVRNNPAIVYPTFESGVFARGDPQFFWNAALLNATVSLAIVILAMFGTEWFLRWRERSKT